MKKDEEEEEKALPGTDEIDPTSLEFRQAFAAARGYPQSIPPAEVMRYWVTARQPGGEESVVNLDCCVDYMKVVDDRLREGHVWSDRVGHFALRLTPMSVDQLHNLVLMLTFRLAQMGEGNDPIIHRKNDESDEVG
jgi:hypothetical protein